MSSPSVLESVISLREKIQEKVKLSDETNESLKFIYDDQTSEKLLDSEDFRQSRGSSYIFILKNKYSTFLVTTSLSLEIYQIRIQRDCLVSQP